MVRLENMVDLCICTLFVYLFVRLSIHSLHTIWICCLPQKFPSFQPFFFFQKKRKKRSCSSILAACIHPRETHFAWAWAARVKRKRYFSQMYSEESKTRHSNWHSNENVCILYGKIDDYWMYCARYTSLIEKVGFQLFGTKFEMLKVFKLHGCCLQLLGNIQTSIWF